MRVGLHSIGISWTGCRKVSVNGIVCQFLTYSICFLDLPQHDFRDLRHHIARQPTPSRPRLHTASPVSTPDDPLILSVLSIGQHPRRGYPITALRHRHPSSFSPAQNYRRSYDISRIRGFGAEVDRNTHRNCALSRWILQKITAHQLRPTLCLAVYTANLGGCTHLLATDTLTFDWQPRLLSLSHGAYCGIQTSGQDGSRNLTRIQYCLLDVRPLLQTFFQAV